MALRVPRPRQRGDTFRGDTLGVPEGEARRGGVDGPPSLGEGDVVGDLS